MMIELCLMESVSVLMTGAVVLLLAAWWSLGGVCLRDWWWWWWWWWWCVCSPQGTLFSVKNFYVRAATERWWCLERVCDGSIYNLYQKVVVVIIVVARLLLLLLLKRRRRKLLLLLRMKVLPRRRMILPASRGHHCRVPHVLRHRRLRGIPSSHASVLWRRRLLLLLL